VFGEVTITLVGGKVRQFVKQFLDFSVHPSNRSGTRRSQGLF
jgi:hypothetical protein